MNRRNFLSTAVVAGGGAALIPAWALRAADGEFPVMRSEEEWRALLSDAEYRVMREEDTERAFTSPLNDEKRAGIYHCKGCDNALYSSEAKFDSGTGWPSFYQAVDEQAVGTKEDRKLFLMVRTECHCADCGSHLGHIFEDGPEPTGLRHCINGVAMYFEPAAA